MARQSDPVCPSTLSDARFPQDGSFFEQSTTTEPTAVWSQCFRSVVPKSGDVSLNFTLKASLLRGILKGGEYGRGELRVARADVEAAPGSRTVPLLRSGQVTGQLHVTLQMQSMPVKPFVVCKAAEG